MSRSRQLPGTETFVWLTWRGSAQQRPREGEELRVWWSGRGDPLARTATTSAPVTPRSAEDGAKLEHAQLSAGHYVAEVVHSKDPAQGQVAELGVSFLRYDRSGSLPHQEIAMDASVTRSIAQWEESQAYRYQTNRAVDWLTRHFLLPSAPGAEPGTPGRVIVSAMPWGNGEASSYQLHGRGYVADVRTIDNQLCLRRLRNPTAGDRTRPLQLVQADVTFKDITEAGQVRADMQRWIDRLASGQGFLAMWEEYNRLEAQHVGRLVRQTGKCSYQEWSRLPEGAYCFSVAAGPGTGGDEPSLLKQAQLALDNHGELHLEVGQKLPPVFSPADDAGQHDWDLIDAKVGQHVFTGTVVAADPAGTITLRRDSFESRGPSRVGGDHAEEPPPTGWLYRSYRGDRQQIARRKKAFNRILAGGTNIPNLLALLEGEQVAVGPRGKIRARSDAAWALFHTEPTPRQEDAIDVALNTPDIAIIQGPPGTGKTEVVAAIQTRLAEEGRSYARVRGSILLASFQHAAVEEMAGRSVIFGIPADKIDRADRGAAELRDKLRDTAIARLKEADSEPVGAVLALHALSGLAAGYWLAPPGADGTVTLLDQVLELARSHISTALLDRLAEARDNRAIALATAKAHGDGTMAHDLALLAVQGLRTTAQTFAEDGPRSAAKVLRRLIALAPPDGRLARADAELLRLAAESAADQAPDTTELAALRDRLLHMLHPATGPAPAAVADPAIVDLLSETVTDMDETLRRSADLGPALAIADYLEALQGDPEAVEWTLRAYTASYATTCQQADSPKIAAAKAVRSDDDILFDTVIIDEAARANPLDLMIPMALAARRIVLVGDHHQLPPLLEPEVERQLGGHEDLRQSLFQRLFEMHRKPGAPIKRVVQLNAQFRMHEVLGEFVSRNFYDGKLISPRGAAPEFAHGLARYGHAVACWVDVPAGRGPEYRSPTMSTFRTAEASWIVDEVDGLVRDHPDLTFGVISFYAEQAEKIGALLAERGTAERVERGRYRAGGDLRHDSRGESLDRLLVGTVDSFQGKQFDVVLLSVTRSATARWAVPPQDPGPYTRWLRSRYGHILLRNRLCVAMSRQRRLLIVVGDAAMFAPGRVPAEAAPFTDFLSLCRAGGDHGRYLSA